MDDDTIDTNDIPIEGEIVATTTDALHALLRTEL